MTANMIIKFFETYGWIMTLLATSGIVLVGIFKAMGLFSKLKDSAKKYVYFACSCIVSIISCTIYLCVSHAFVWADWGVTVVFIIAYTMALYALYENTGIRALLKKLLFKPIKTMLHKAQVAIFTKTLNQEQTIKLAKGLGEEVLSQLVKELSIMHMDNCDTNPNETICLDSETDMELSPTNQYQKTNFFS